MLVIKQRKKHVIKRLIDSTFNFLKVKLVLLQNDVKL